MGSYDCVLPIDFEIFSKSLIPAWLQVLDGILDCQDFQKEFVPAGSEYFDLGECGEALPLPREYTDWFRMHSASQWIGKSLRAQLICATSQRFWPSENVDIEIFVLALKQTCAKELLGKDSFAGESYWCRLHDAPRVQVAGTKNGFDFLKCFYSSTWHQSDHVVVYQRNGRVSDDLYQLLEALFFGERVLPGICPLKKVPSWRASTDLFVQGHLVPEEVQKLASRVPELAREIGNADALFFPMFADRLTRAANQGAALVTIVDGL